MTNKPIDSKKILFTPFLMARIIIPGLLKTIISFALYFYISSNYNESFAGAAVFMTLSIIEILFAYICRSSKRSVFKIGLISNKPMLLCVLGTLFIQILIFCVPSFASLLSVPNMPNNIYMIIAIVSIFTAILFEIIKLILAKIFKND